MISEKILICYCNFVFIKYIVMPSTIRSIIIKHSNLPYSLKFSKDNDGIRISIPSFGETLPNGTTHFSDEFKNVLNLKPSVITKIETFVIDCVESNPPNIMFELNTNTGPNKQELFLDSEKLVLVSKLILSGHIKKI